MKKLLLFLATVSCLLSYSQDCSNTVSICYDLNNASYINNNGSVEITSVSGGTSPYTYNWSTGSDSTSADSLSSTGSPYTLTITDASGCETVSCYFIQSAEIPCTYVTSDVCGDTLALNYNLIYLQSIIGASSYNIMMIDTADITDTTIAKVPNGTQDIFTTCWMNDDNYNLRGGIQYLHSYQIWTQTVIGEDSSVWCTDTCIITIQDIPCLDLIITNSDTINGGQSICQQDTVYFRNDPNYIRVTPFGCNLVGFQFQVIRVGSGDPDGNLYYRNHNSFPLIASYGIDSSGATYKVLVRGITKTGDTLACQNIDTCEFVFIDTINTSLIHFESFGATFDRNLNSEYDVINEGEKLRLVNKSGSGEESAKAIQQVEILSINGQLVISEDVKQVQTDPIELNEWSSLSPGIYLIRILFSDGSLQATKMVKQ